MGSVQVSEEDNPKNSDAGTRHERETVSDNGQDTPREYWRI